MCKHRFFFLRLFVHGFVCGLICVWLHVRSFVRVCMCVRFRAWIFLYGFACGLVCGFVHGFVCGFSGRFLYNPLCSPLHGFVCEFFTLFASFFSKKLKTQPVSYTRNRRSSLRQKQQIVFWRHTFPSGYPIFPVNFNIFLVYLLTNLKNCKNAIAFKVGLCYHGNA